MACIRFVSPLVQKLFVVFSITITVSLTVAVVKVSTSIWTFHTKLCWLSSYQPVKVLKLYSRFLTWNVT
ncbi:hypothetical protein D9M73_264480 [compost metagenome]